MWPLRVQTGGAGLVLAKRPYAFAALPTENSPGGKDTERKEAVARGVCGPSDPHRPASRIAGVV